MATELILIRHGNAVRVNGDYFHAPLTSTGQEQAARTGQYFTAAQNHLDGFYSSPLRRAQEDLTLAGLRIGDARVDLRCHRRGSSTRVEATAVTGELRVAVRA